MNNFLLALWFFVPAGAANAAPIFAAYAPVVRKVNTPLDFGRKFRNERLLGDNKTWRGVAAGIVFAVCTVWLQQVFVRHVLRADSVFGIDYSQLPTVPLGVLFGIGALGGDALKSFFKRRIGTAPGRSWVPFDQLDYIIGSALATALVVRLPVVTYGWAVIVWALLHVATTFAGYRVGLKERPI